MAEENDGTAVKRMAVRFDCTGTATGRMRNELDVRMVSPSEERFQLATDEGSFHGGEATAPPPLALFVGGLVGCIMTQIRAFAKRMRVPVDHLAVEARIEWEWQQEGREPYTTAPKGFALDITLDSSAPREDVRALIQAAKRGCFVEQTLGRANVITHRLKTPGGWEEV
jgi:uncharacterized OsmC-like protein